MALKTTCEEIRVNTQSSIRIGGSKVVWFDPFKVAEETHDADLICITHEHYDHLDPESIAKVRKPGTVFAAPASMAGQLKKVVGDGDLRLMMPGDELEMEGISLKGLPSYNKLKPFHPKKKQWLGYLLAMDGIRYYVAGDTDAVEELGKVSCDVAMVPIGGTYTMTAPEAAGLINRIRPSVAIPIHYGSIVGKPADADRFRELVGPETEVILKL